MDPKENLLRQREIQAELGALWPDTDTERMLELYRELAELADSIDLYMRSGGQSPWTL